MPDRRQFRRYERQIGHCAEISKKPMLDGRRKGEADKRACLAVCQPWEPEYGLEVVRTFTVNVGALCFSRWTSG